MPQADTPSYLAKPGLMFKASDFVEKVTDVPPHWIFEYYLQLAQPLTGQTVMMHSIFNDKDKTPSMSLYFNKTSQEYKFKCFSTGKSGSAIDMMRHLWGCDFATASYRIIKDYLQFKKEGTGSTERVIMQGATWKVSDYTPRLWTKTDAAYWGPFNISSTLLEHYNVKPLLRYTMTRNGSDCEDDQVFETTGDKIYGYFNRQGKLYKIYRPGDKKHKFMKVAAYLQGYDQLEGHRFLVICSSLKDVMTLRSLKLQLDAIAPDSENSMIPQETLRDLMDTYDGVITLFDSDDAGIRSMKKYQELYGIPFVYLPMSKDLSDSVRDHKPGPVLRELLPRITNALDKYNQLQSERQQGARI